MSIPEKENGQAETPAFPNLDIAGVMARSTSRRGFLRASAGVGLAAAALLGLDACGASSSVGSSSSVKLAAKVDGNLNYFNWSGYIPGSVIKGFEKEYGVKVHQTFFSSDDEMLTKLAAGLPYDFVCTNSAYMSQLVGGKLIRPLPHDQLKNWDQVTGFFQNPPYDPGSKYTAPYAYSPTGIAWLTAKVSSSTMTGSWNDLWTHAEKGDKVFMLSQMEEVIGASLLRLGYPIDSTSPSQINKAVQQLIDLKPHLSGFSDSDYTNLENQTAWVQHAWSGDVYIAIGAVKQKKSIRFETTPKEGIPIGVDTMSIGAKANHPGTALLFIDWVLRPDNSAACVENMGQATGTKAGDAKFNSLVSAYPFLQTSDTVLQHGSWKKVPTGPAATLWSQAWAKVQA